MPGEMANEIKLISGRSHPDLSDKIAKRYVPTALPRPPVPAPTMSTSAPSRDSDADSPGPPCHQPPLLTLTPRSLGVQVARTIALNYSNQETSFTVGESVRDEDVFIIQSTATGDVNEGLMELLIMISACRTARCDPSTTLSASTGR